MTPLQIKLAKRLADEMARDADKVSKATEIFSRRPCKGNALAYRRALERFRESSHLHELADYAITSMAPRSDKLEIIESSSNKELMTLLIQGAPHPNRADIVAELRRRGIDVAKATQFMLAAIRNALGTYFQ